MTANPPRLRKKRKPCNHCIGLKRKDITAGRRDYLVNRATRFSLSAATGSVRVRSEKKCIPEK
jgi:hypothetical protein